MNIHTYGVDERLRFCREYLLKKNIRSAGDITLLPIPTTRDGKTLHGTRDTLDSVKCGLCVGDILVGYEVPREFRAELIEAGVTVIDVSRDEDFLVENAELTAVGTVGRLLTEEKAAPGDLSIGIIGYGRIGQRLLRHLMFLGASVTVFTSKSELRRELCMLGVSGVDSLSFETPEAYERLSELDILINTAPARLISGEARGALSTVRIIELASGDNFPEGIFSEKFSSVPAVMYPKSAGIALGRAVLRMMGERDIKC